jgi:hypothetical protein
VHAVDATVSPEVEEDNFAAEVGEANRVVGVEPSDSAVEFFSGTLGKKVALLVSLADEDFGVGEHHGVARLLGVDSHSEMVAFNGYWSEYGDYGEIYQETFYHQV